MSDKSYMTFYHYTDKNSLKKVKASGVLKKSMDGFDGPGVYLTTLPPNTMKGFLAINNYDGYALTENDWVRMMYREGRVDCYIEIKLKKPWVRKLKAGQRNIWIFPYKDIKLDRLEQRVHVGIVGGKRETYQKKRQLLKKKKTVLISDEEDVDTDYEESEEESSEESSEESEEESLEEESDEDM